jgi:hypothetical protein
MYGGFALPANLMQFTGPLSSPFGEDLWYGNLTWQPDGDNLVELSNEAAQRTEITASVARTRTTTAPQGKRQHAHRPGAGSQRGELAQRCAPHLRGRSVEPACDQYGIGFQFTGTSDDARGRRLNVGAGRDFQDKGQKGWSLQDDFTWLGLEGHTMKVGFKYKAVEINAFEQQPYNPHFLINLPLNLLAGNDSFDTYVPYEVRFGALVPGATTRNITTDAKQFGIYFQDDWQVTEHLISTSACATTSRRTTASRLVTPQNIADALRNWPNITAPTSNYNIEKLHQQRHTRDADSNNSAARLGLLVRHQRRRAPW